MHDELITLDTWVTSDHHWAHDNIRVYQNRPDNHFELMSNLWHDTVRYSDTVLHLGDLVYGGRSDTHAHWLVGLPGRKLLLKGNHDKHPSSWYEAQGFSVLGRKPFTWVAPDHSVICFSHEPADDDYWDLNVHGHIHGNPYWGEMTRVADRRNVSVEVTGYKPVRLRDVLDGVVARA